MQIYGVVGWMAAMLVSRMISERGYQTLNEDEKLRLMDGFSKSRAYSMVLPLLTVCAFLFLIAQTSIDRTLLSIGYFTLLFVYLVWMANSNQKKLRSLEMPTEYRTAFTISQCISMAGLAWLFFAVFFSPDFFG